MENGCDYDIDIANIAAANGHLDCLIYLHEEEHLWYGRTCSAAAENGHLDCLIYLHENGHLDCLIYLHENGCPWDQETTHFAVYNSRLDCLKYAIENGCPVDKSICMARAMYPNILEYLASKGLCL